MFQNHHHFYLYMKSKSDVLWTTLRACAIKTIQMRLQRRIEYDFDILVFTAPLYQSNRTHMLTKQSLNVLL